MAEISGSRYILWLGSVFDEPTMLESPAVSPAANHWERGLITALRAAGPGVVALGHLPEPVWPKGRARIDERRGTSFEGLSSRLVPYWNLPLLRISGLRQGYLAGFERLVSSRGVPSALITYNPYPYNVTVGRRAQTAHGIPWFCVVADGIGRRSRSYDRRADLADGRIFLPWSGYRTCPVEPNLHLDGGVEAFLAPSASEGASVARAILYAGRMTRSNGVELLVEAYEQLRRPGVELWLCGKGHNARVNASAARHPGVQAFGPVTEKRLRELSHAASVFVNPRLPAVPGNAMLFPSKVLRYLAYGKPVVSTWTEGLAPEYRGVLQVPQDDSAPALARKLNEVLDWEPQRRDEERARIGQFVEDRLWSRQAERLLRWMEKVRPAAGDAA